MGHLSLPDKWRDEDDLDGGLVIGQSEEPLQNNHDRNEEPMDRGSGFTRLSDDLTLPGGHPLAGRAAVQCDICRGIFYPNGDEPVECPYCADDEDAA